MADEKKNLLGQQDAENAREDDKELSENDLKDFAGGCEDCGQKFLDFDLEYEADDDAIKLR